MSLPVVFVPEAEDEFDEAVKWNEERRTGSGRALFEEVQRIVALIEQIPEMYPVDLDSIRRGDLPTFPYGVYYRVHSDRIEVIQPDGRGDNHPGDGSKIKATAFPSP